MNKKTVVLTGIIFLIVASILFTNMLKNKPTVPVAQNVVTKNTVAENAVKKYSLQDVAQHKNETSCWTVINGKVYDLTSWINQHPGGPERILGVCGIDGSPAFNAQHGAQGEPNSQLATFYIGEFAST